MLKKPVYIVMLFQLVQLLFTAGLTVYMYGYPPPMGTEAAGDYVHHAVGVWLGLFPGLILVFGAYVIASQIPRWNEEAKRWR